MKKRFEKFHNLRLAGEFDKALVELAKVEKQHQLPPNILVWKGICILLGSANSPYDLEDAEVAFKAALAIDKEHVHALLELGYLYLRLHDKAQKAVPYFRRALKLTRSNMTQAIQGLAESLCETKSPKEASKFIEDVITKPFDQQKITESIEYINMLKSKSLDGAFKLLGKEVEMAHRARRTANAMPAQRRKK